MVRKSLFDDVLLSYIEIFSDSPVPAIPVAEKAEGIWYNLFPAQIESPHIWLYHLNHSLWNTTHLFITFLSMCWVSDRYRAMNVTIMKQTKLQTSVWWLDKQSPLRCIITCNVQLNQKILYIYAENKWVLNLVKLLKQASSWFVVGHLFHSFRCDAKTWNWSFGRFRSRIKSFSSIWLIGWDRI